MVSREALLICMVGMVLALGLPAMAVNIETVTVGNPDNAGEGSGLIYGGYGPARICGAVGYTYNIGKYEVTAGQYTKFLNAVAAGDPHGLFNTSMADSTDLRGCNIQRSGSSGSYTYSVASDWENRPVNFVSFWDACRFANWLHNGQGGGDTETGAYTMTTEGIANNTVTRNDGWKWALTSEDEWYKAAYHRNDGVTGNYFDYPTGSDTRPNNALDDPDPGNNANFYDSGYTIDSPYYRTEIGEFENSQSPYGTFDQGGNVFERNEAIIDSSFRGVRGGSFFFDDYAIHAALRGLSHSTTESHDIGFRVVEVPEPATTALLALGGLALLNYKRKSCGIRRRR